MLLALLDLVLVKKFINSLQCPRISKKQATSEKIDDPEIFKQLDYWATNFWEYIIALYYKF